jgi:hypothetical protein
MALTGPRTGGAQGDRVNHGSPEDRPKDAIKGTAPTALRFPPDHRGTGDCGPDHGHWLSSRPYRADPRRGPHPGSGSATPLTRNSPPCHCRGPQIGDREEPRPSLDPGIHHCHPNRCQLDQRLPAALPVPPQSNCCPITRHSVHPPLRPRAQHVTAVHRHHAVPPIAAWHAACKPVSLPFIHPRFRAAPQHRRPGHPG